MEKTAEEYLRLICEKLDIPWVIHNELCVADLIDNYVYNEWRKKHLSVNNKLKYYDYTLIHDDFNIQVIRPYLFKINDKFIQCSVNYDSWMHENEFLGCHFVEPVEKTIIDYVKIGE